jgi:hypothetical protein
MKKGKPEVNLSKYQRICENSQYATLVSDPGGQIIIANTAVCALFKLTKEELCKKNLFNLASINDPRFIHLVEECNQKGETEGEITLIKKDGSKFPARIFSKIYSDENAKLIISTIHELFERGKIEEGLRNDFARYQLAIDAGNDGMWDLDIKNDKLFLSSNASKMFGQEKPITLTREEFWQNSFIHEDFKQILHDEFIPILSGQSDIIDTECKVKTLSHAWRWIRLRGKVISRALDGSPIHMLGTLTDVTDRKQTKEELRIIQKRFKSYFDNSSVGLVIHSNDGSWVELNQELCNMLGYNKEELIRKSWEELTYSEDIHAKQLLINDVIDGKIDSYKVDQRLIRKDGKVIYTNLSSICVRNNDGSINYFLSSLVDLTQHNKMEEDIKLQRIVLRTLIDNHPYSIYIIDKDGRKLISNKADWETVGCDNEAEVLGKTDLELYPGKVGERGHNDNMFVITNKTPILNREEDFLDKEGNQKWLLTSKIPLFDHKNQISGLIGIGIDITEQRNLRQQIIESEAYYRTLVDISPEGIFVTDLEGKLTFLSKKVYHILEVPDNVNLIGKSIFHWTASESLEVAIADYKDDIDGKRPPQQREYKCFRYDRSEFWGEFSSSPLFDSSGILIGFMLVCRNISDRKKIEEDLISAKKRAEESDKLKTALLRNISHEIRTPLNAILGFSSLLGEPDLSNKMLQSYVKTIQISSDHLLSIITDLIDMSLIEAKIIEQYKSQVYLNGLLKDIQNQFQLRAKSKNIILTLKEGFSNDKSNISADLTKLVQIISNLLNNAIKFTQSGQINFGYSLKESLIEFYVSDTGVGIPSKYHSRIFDTFFQVEHELSRSFEGTGLGLSICKAYVELLGGTIWLTSKLGEGSTFFFTIPYEPVELSHLVQKSIPSYQ